MPAVGGIAHSGEALCYQLPLLSHERRHRVTKTAARGLCSLAVGVTAPAEQMAPALGRDEAPMPHGASAARGDELDVPIQAGGSVSRELQERYDSGDSGKKRPS